ncbi:hypothetical protein E2C01_058551 [Portunus trituberculatus]|uniref:Uncharacterized protein n=1 Tax=Portunus trituberculatus TaxID=210409 RepID=A0A5B7H491_PORTR|nr:hypothetical protein [Portunus trituberculatus]
MAKCFKAVRGGIQSYAWTSARSHAHHLIHRMEFFKLSKHIGICGVKESLPVHTIGIGGEMAS